MPYTSKGNNAISFYVILLLHLRSCFVEKFRFVELRLLTANELLWYHKLKFNFSNEIVILNLKFIFNEIGDFCFSVFFLDIFDSEVIVKKKKNMENGKGRFAIYLMLYAIYRRFVSTYFDVESDFNKFKKICVVRKIQ